MIHSTCTWCTSTAQTKTREVDESESWKRKAGVKKTVQSSGWAKETRGRARRRGEDKEYCIQKQREVEETEEQSDIYNKKQKPSQRSIVKETNRHGGIICFVLLFTQLLWIGMDFTVPSREGLDVLPALLLLLSCSSRMRDVCSVTLGLKPINTDKTGVNRPATDKDDQTLLLSHGHVTKLKHTWADAQLCGKKWGRLRLCLPPHYFCLCRFH